MSKEGFAYYLTLGCGFYDYVSVGNTFSSTKTTMEAAGTWSSSDWGKYESQALYGLIFKAVIFPTAFIIRPIILNFHYVTMLIAAEEVYKYTLLTKAMDTWQS